MPEYLKRVYNKEEEFLDKFADVAEAVSRSLGNDWEPNYWCNDKTREKTKYLLSTGELHKLTFDSASVRYSKEGFSSAQIVLQSSVRIVTMRVKKASGDLIAENLAEQKRLPIG